MGWLTELPPLSRRTVRMEALIARLRLALVGFNGLMLTLFLDTSRMHLQVAWGLIIAVTAYGLFVVAVRPYERWRIFRASMLTTAVDSVMTAAFIGATGGSHSPFYPIYFLVAVSVGMRFDLRQALIASAVFIFTYSVAFFVTWGGTANEFGELAIRCVYMTFAAVGVGYLAREENSRSRQVEVIERLHAENAKLLSRTERAARVDKLTGLLNRASLEKEAQREVRKARAAGGYLSVLFCDLDRLKRINDELGHDVGDRVLKQAGAALRQKLRAQDLVGRYGGDEFVVILPSLTRETAYDRAEQLIAQITAASGALPDDLQIGLSVGVATYPFDAQDYPTLVKVADQAMYLGKREGGNRVRTANDLRLFWEEMPRPA
ncbi:MAG TPA: diguanylate cyclase [Dehalococcoidia bacterium]|nr:diguanylate cyclase [Dehalococcoidia bacterium]